MDKIFKANLAIIALVSLVDVYFSIKLAATLWTDERNPFGRWLIWFDGGDVALFMTCKIVGTILAIYILTQLYQIRQLWAEICACIIALSQLILLAFLLF